MTEQEIIIGLQEVFDTVFSEVLPVRRALKAADVEEWDSILHVSLIVAIERHFHFRTQLGEVEMLKNVGDLIDLIARHQRQLSGKREG